MDALGPVVLVYKNVCEYFDTNLAGLQDIKGYFDQHRRCFKSLDALCTILSGVNIPRFATHKVVLVKLLFLSR